MAPSLCVSYVCVSLRVEDYFGGFWPCLVLVVNDYCSLICKSSFIVHFVLQRWNEKSVVLIVQKSGNPEAWLFPVVQYSACQVVRGAKSKVKLNSENCDWETLLNTVWNSQAFFMESFRSLHGRRLSNAALVTVSGPGWQLVSLEGASAGLSLSLSSLSYFFWVVFTFSSLSGQS